MAVSVINCFISSKVRADRHPFSHICGKNCHSVRRIFFRFYELTELTPPFPQLDEILYTDFYAYYRQ